MHCLGKLHSVGAAVLGKWQFGTELGVAGHWEWGNGWLSKIIANQCLLLIEEYDHFWLERFCFCFCVCISLLSGMDGFRGP